jgi:thiamine-phosphate pyrophosphorylase
MTLDGIKKFLIDSSEKDPFVNFGKNGVYWLTPSGIEDTKKLILLTRQVLNGGASMVQYRQKSLNYPKKRHQALQLKKICAAYKVPFIINDSVDLALAVDADGVHIGKSDSSLKTARDNLGEHKIIGVSCYNDIDRAQHMLDNGANYIAFGRFYPSLTKPEAPMCSLEVLKVARKKFSSSIVAIGGINLDNASNLIINGATHIAVVDAISKAKCPYVATKRLSGLFNKIL